MRLELITACGCTKTIETCDPGREYRVPLHRGRNNDDVTAPSYIDRRFLCEGGYDHPLHGRTFVYREVLV